MSGERFHQNLQSRGRVVAEAVQGRPLAGLITFCLLAMLVLHLVGWIKVDGWAILLFVIALLPWSVPAILSTIATVSDAFGKSTFKSIQFGTFKIEQLERKVSEQSALIDEHRRMLDDLTLYSMAFYIYDKLKYLHLGTLQAYRSRFGEYNYVRNEVFDHDLRYLRDHGYLELFQISDLTPGENLVGKLQVTEMGRRFVELKEARQSNGSSG